MNYIKNTIDNFVFFPDKIIHHTPSYYNIKYEDVNVTNKFENTIYLNEKYHGWYIQGKKTNNNLENHVILFIHGNGGNISNRLKYIKIFHNLGINTLFFDYPGFGMSDGNPNENNCIKCGNLFLNFLIHNKKFDKNKIILYGESIGGSIATSLAYNEKINYLILQSTFSDIKILIEEIMKIPGWLLRTLGFETKNILKKRHKLNLLKKKMKTLVIHSKEDNLIPYSHALILKKYADDFYTCKGDHTNPIIDDEFINVLLQFILNNNNN